jgi:hypothetical protein
VSPGKKDPLRLKFAREEKNEISAIPSGSLIVKVLAIGAQEFIAKELIDKVAFVVLQEETELNDELESDELELDELDELLTHEEFGFILHAFIFMEYPQVLEGTLD